MMDRSDDDLMPCEVEGIHPEMVRLASSALISAGMAEHMGRIFQALADPSRLRLISALTRGELCVCDLAAVRGMSQSAVSHQLRLLRNLQLVRSRKDGRVVYYALDDEHIRDLFERGMAHTQHTQLETQAGSISR